MLLQFTFKIYFIQLYDELLFVRGKPVFLRLVPYITLPHKLKLTFYVVPVTEVILPVNRITRKVKGYAVVTFVVPENAAKACMKFDGSIFHGRMLNLLPGKSKQSLEELMEKGKT